MRIAVFGAGYVGLANALYLARHNEVTVVDIAEDRVKLIEQRISPIHDREIETALQDVSLNLNATSDADAAYHQSEVIIIATPTDYDTEKNFFCTSSVEKVLQGAVREAPKAIVVVKSTVPIGWTARTRELYPNQTLIFSPEFLREGRALYDNYFLSRVIVGDSEAIPSGDGYEGSEAGKIVAKLLLQGAKKKSVPVLFMPPTEAEAVKLFANSYLALRISYFNELDTFAEIRGLNTLSVVNGICLDPRIGGDYNNPSFGYGGYCLPKDTKQLMQNYHDVPNELIKAIISSNSTRMDHIANMICARKPKCVGVWRLAMKSGSDNARSSAVLGIIERLKTANVPIIIYEPLSKTSEVEGCKIENDIPRFLQHSSLIIANRLEPELLPVREKVYTRDLFSRD